VIQTSINRTNAYENWVKLIVKCNKIPSIKKENCDFTAYITDQAIKGLFTMIAREEAKIRQNPAARTSALLKKAFGQN
jgi:hypothetical protein